MPLSLKKLNQIDEKKWENLVLTSKYSSFYHTLFWAGIWEKSFPFCEALFFVLEEQNYLAGLPLIRFKKKGLLSFFSMPFGTYGGVIGNLSEEQKIQFLRRVVKFGTEKKHLRLQIVDFFDQNKELEKLNFKKIPTFTHTINLENSRSEIGFQKRGYEQSLKKELSVREIGSLDEVKICYQLYLTTAQKHQLKQVKYPLKFYENLFLSGANSNHLKWWIVSKEKQIMAYQINFVCKDTLYYWDGASWPDFLHDRPNDALMGHSIKWAKENSLKFYNLGGSPEKAEGLIKFKEDWGGERKNYFIYERQSTLGKIQKAVRKFL